MASSKIPNWKYKNRHILSLQDLPSGTEGFVYRIHFPDTDQSYIGKKSVVSKRKKNFSATKIAAMPNKRLKKYEYVYKESDWKTYTSSSEPVSKLIADGRPYVREILACCSSKGQLTYMETKLLFAYGVLEGDDERYFNNSILGRFYRKNIG